MGGCTNVCKDEGDCNPPTDGLWWRDGTGLLSIKLTKVELPTCYRNETTRLNVINTSLKE